MIAVTGGLGTGKSTVSKILALALDGQLVDTDQICREQLEPGAAGYVQVNDVFGPEFIQSDGHINRDLLRQKVFDDQLARKKLEDILHPIVAIKLQEYRENSIACNQYLVVEVPLLFEVGWQTIFDSIAVVYVPEQLGVDRVRLRNNLSHSLIKQIMGSQLEIGIKRGLADYCIDNSGTFASTVQQVHWFARTIKGQKNSGHYH